MEAAGVLSSTFALGILLHAAQSSFYSAVHGHYKTLFLHRRRLILLLFLFSASILAISQFVVLLLLEDIPCQIAVIFSTTFDQFTRVTAFGFIVSKLAEESRYKFERIGLYGFLVLRALMGGVVVVFTRTQFIPVCFARPLIPAPSYGQLGMDAVFILYFLLRIPGLFRLFLDSGTAGVRASDQKSQGYGLFLISCTFLCWFFSSLGLYINQWSIFVRIVPMCLALTLVIAVIRLFPSIVYSMSAKDKAMPPYRMRRLDSTSPIAATSGARLTPSTAAVPPRGSDIENPLTPPTALRARSPRNGTTGTNVFKTIIGQPIQPTSTMNAHPGDPLPWGMDDGTMRTRSSRYLSGFSRASVALVTDGKKSLMETFFPAHAGGKSQISGPMTADGGFGTVGSSGGTGGGIKTISLAEAAEEQRRKRMEAAAREEAGGLTPKSAPIPKDVDVRSMERTLSVKRKALDRSASGASNSGVPSVPSRPAREEHGEQQSVMMLPSNPRGGGLGASQVDNLNRISEYTTVSTETDFSNRFSQVFPNSLQPAPRGPIPALPTQTPPQDARRNSRRNSMALNNNSPQIMYMNRISYHNPNPLASALSSEFGFHTAPTKPAPTKPAPTKPAPVKALPSNSRPISSGTAPRKSYRNSNIRRRSPLGSRLTILAPLKEGNELPTPSPPPLTPILDRKTPKRRTIDGRALFPYDPLTPTKSVSRRSRAGSLSAVPPQLPPPTIPLPLPPIETCPTEGKEVDEKAMTRLSDFPSPPLEAFNFPSPPVDTLAFPSPPTVVPQTVAELFDEKAALPTPPPIPPKSNRRSSVPSIIIDALSSTSSSPRSEEAFSTAQAWIAALSTGGKQLNVPRVVEISAPEKLSTPNNMKRLSTISDVSSRYSPYAPTPKKRESYGQGKRDSNPRYSFIAASYNLPAGVTANVRSARSNSTASEPSEAGEMTDSSGEYSESDGSLSDIDLHYDDVMVEDQFADMSDIELEMVEERRAEEPVVLRSPLHHGFAQRPLSIAAHFAEIPYSARARLGDHIPTFSSRYESSSKRKPPPSPIGFLLRGQRVKKLGPDIRQSFKPSAEDVEIDARLSVLKSRIRSGGLGIDEIMQRLPTAAERRRSRRRTVRESVMSEASVGTVDRNSLLERLEMEMDGQQQNWMSMHQNLRDSVTSVGTATTGMTTEDASSQSTTARLSGIYRKSQHILRSLNEEQVSLDETISSEETANAGSWQQRVAEAQQTYVDETAASWRPERMSEVSGYTTESMEIMQPQPKHGVFLNANVNLFFEAAEEEILQSEAEEGEVMVSPAESAGTEFEMSDEEEEVEKGLFEFEAPAIQHDLPAEEYFSPLPPTVYVPDPSIFSQISTFRSPSISTPQQTPSLLWNPLPPTFDFFPTTGLWSFSLPSLPHPDLTPPALTVRPKQRKTAHPLAVTSTRLWTVSSTLAPSERTGSGLWISSRKATKVVESKKAEETTTAKTARKCHQHRPKSILIINRPGDRVGRVKSAKKVVFSPEVYSPGKETAGLMSALKSYLASEKTNTTLASPDQSQIEKYGERPLPPVPTEIVAASLNAIVNCEREAESPTLRTPRVQFKQDVWVEDTLPETGLCTATSFTTTPKSTTAQLWGSTETLAQLGFNSNYGPSPRRALPALPATTLNSTSLWTINSASSSSPTMACLWQPPTTSSTHLWPHGSTGSMSQPTTTALWTSTDSTKVVLTNKTLSMKPSATAPHRVRSTVRGPYSPVASTCSTNLWTCPPKQRDTDLIWLRRTGRQSPPIPAIPAPAPAAESDLPAHILIQIIDVHKLPRVVREQGLWQNNLHASAQCAAAVSAAAALVRPGLWAAADWQTAASAIRNHVGGGSTNVDVACADSGPPSRARCASSPLEIQSFALWTFQPSPAQKPRLWTDIRSNLWTATNCTPNLDDMAQTTTTMWGSGISLFHDLSTETLRYVRPANKSPLPTFEQSLWTRIEEAVEEIREEGEGLWKPLAGVERALERLVGTMESMVFEHEQEKKEGLWSPPAKKVEMREFEHGSLWTKESHIKNGIFEGLNMATNPSPRLAGNVLTLMSDSLWTKPAPVAPKIESEGLWTPTTTTSTTTALWQPTSTPITPTVSSHLWHQSTATRTTHLHPEPFYAPIRKDTSDLLPVTGSLWAPSKATAIKPSLWSKEAGWYTVGAFKTSPKVGLMWTKETAARTTTRLPEPFERVKKEFVGEVEAVAGPMWSVHQTQKAGLWKKSGAEEKWYTVGAVKVAPVAGPMWNKHTASRTTTMLPEPFVRPKKESVEEVEAVAGPMWSPYKTQKASLWTKDNEKWYTVGAVKITPQAGPMWAKHTASRTTTLLPEPFVRPKKEFTDEVEAVSGPMWSAAVTSTDKPSLWTKPSKWYTVGAVQIAPKAGPMWTAATASRTTTLAPSPFTPKKKDFDAEVASVSGPMWSATLKDDSASLWTFKKSVPGLWQSTTKEATESLWKRRSAALAPATLSQPIKRSSFLPQKVVRTDADLPAVHSELWRLVEQERAPQMPEGLWNGPASPALSATSTLSDISELETAPSSMTHNVAVRIVRSNSDLSDAPSPMTGGLNAGLWIKSSGSSEVQPKKEIIIHGLWSFTSASRKYHSLLVTEKPLRFTERLRSDNLPTFHPAEHTLWQPAAQMSYTQAMSQYEYVLGSAAQRSGSFYSDDGETCDSPFSDISRDSFATQYCESVITEADSLASPDLVKPLTPIRAMPSYPSNDSPFATTLRVSSLRKKLRPVIVCQEKRPAPRSAGEAFKPKRHVTQSVILRGKMGREEKGEEGPVMPSRGYLWSKGIV